jgi:hypothetical protein
MLSGDSYRVVCFVRNPLKIDSTIKSKVEIIEGDCTDASAVKSNMYTKY